MHFDENVWLRGKGKGKVRDRSMKVNARNGFQKKVLVDTSIMDIEDLRNYLEKYGQEHLLHFWEDLGVKQKGVLVQEILGLNLEEANSCFKRAMESMSNGKEFLDDKMEPIPSDSIESAKNSEPGDLDKYGELGLKEISEGKAAVLLMAGGQGTRLGVEYPKGMYDVGLPSGSTLYQLQAERIQKLQSLAQEKFGKCGPIQWYIMTSDATDEITINYFKKNNYFGLNKNNIVAFRQNMLPCFSFDGKIILDEKHRIAQAPDGNGGLYKALKNAGILEDMRKRGIRSVHAFSVDNILVKVADPVFLGFCLSHNADCGAKAVEKRCPSEAVGVICKVNGRYRVVEYSEIKKETSELRRSNGKLVFDAGNICNHYFTVDFLYSIAEKFETEMELHVAKKKIPVVDEEGNRIVPSIPNGIKIEKFAFDVFRFAENFVAWQVDRNSEFSPLKNADSIGIDCPKTAKNDVLALHKKWLLNAGAVSVKGEVEVSPLVSYAGENLENLVEGKSFNETFVLDHEK